MVCLQVNQRTYEACNFNCFIESRSQSVIKPRVGLGL